MLKFENLVLESVSKNVAMDFASVKKLEGIYDNGDKLISSFTDCGRDRIVVIFNKNTQLCNVWHQIL